MNDDPPGPGRGERDSSEFLDPLPLSPREVSPDVAEELLAAAGALLPRYALVGTLRLEGLQLLLQTQQRSVRVPLGNWVHEWTRLPAARRETHLHAALRQLAETKGRSPSSSPPPTVIIGTLWPLLAIGGAAACALWFFLGTNAAETAGTSRRAPAEARPSPTATMTTANDERDQRLCAVSRSRLREGAIPSRSDAAGAVVEYVAWKLGAKAPLDTAPALSPFVRRTGVPGEGALAWKGSPELTKRGEKARLRVQRETLRSASGESIPGVRLVLGDELVEAYFVEEERPALIEFARSVSLALGVTHAALYARCAKEAIPIAPAWFRGLNPGDAATAVLATVALHSEPRQIAAPFLRPPSATDDDPDFAFTNLRAKTERLDEAALRSLTVRGGGTVTVVLEVATEVTFAYREANRAERFSRELARLVSLAPAQ